MQCKGPGVNPPKGVVRGVRGGASQKVVTGFSPKSLCFPSGQVTFLFSLFVLSWSAHSDNALLFLIHVDTDQYIVIHGKDEIVFIYSIHGLLGLRSELKATYLKLHKLIKS